MTSPPHQITAEVRQWSFDPKLNVCACPMFMEGFLYGDTLESLPDGTYQRIGNIAFIIESEDGFEVGTFSGRSYVCYRIHEKKEN